MKWTGIPQFWVDTQRLAVIPYRHFGLATSVKCNYYTLNIKRDYSLHFFVYHTVHDMALERNLLSRVVGVDHAVLG